MTTDASSCNTGATTLSCINFSGYVGHVTIFSWMLTVACCLALGLGWEFDLVSDWLVVMHSCTPVCTTFRWHCHNTNCVWKNSSSFSLASCFNSARLRLVRFSSVRCVPTSATEPSVQLEPSVDRPQTAGRAIQPFQTPVEDIFIWSLGPKCSVNPPLEILLLTKLWFVKLCSSQWRLISTVRWRTTSEPDSSRADKCASRGSREQH